ncbi:hypothetical protein J2W22_002509 [Sphingomonas kyeonggiensis]|uniref:DUF4328 domain-containing protein n=1 Tax=Sphingomonas kyeonggiensis TaxID=1268553 RepID=UPI00277E1D15|nr:DUF4328 domain-containing protein [Sphingomonas kyeonggiensis]MDQ0250445.1 hypothetical protein [Sphingomonas kyeonggiensis]
MEPRNLKLLTYVVITMVVIDALGVPAIAMLVQLAPAFFTTAVSPIANEIDAGTQIFKLATMVLFAWWIVRAGSNLVAMGYEDLSFSPASRVWWFAIPFANLVQPYLGMRELWNASHGKEQYDETVPLIAIWWGLWLANGFLALVLNIMIGAGEMTALWIQGGIDLALAFVVIQLLRGISHAQAALRGPQLSEVFA